MYFAYCELHPRTGLQMLTRRFVLVLLLLRNAALPAHRTAAPRDVPGSRLLLSDSAAKLRSGSPPGVGPLYPPSVCNFLGFLPNP